MSMPPAVITLQVWADQTFADTFTLYESDGVTPINLTGCSCTVTVRPYAEAFDPPFALWTDTAANIVLGGTAGTITFAIPASATAALATSNNVPNPFDVQVWVYNMVLTYAGGQQNVVMQGSFIWYPSVTGTRTASPAPAPWPGCCP